MRCSESLRGSRAVSPSGSSRLLAVAVHPPEVLPEVVAGEHHGLDTCRAESLEPAFCGAEKRGADTLSSPTRRDREADVMPRDAISLLGLPASWRQNPGVDARACQLRQGNLEVRAAFRYDERHITRENRLYSQIRKYQGDVMAVRLDGCLVEWQAEFP
jgi:hypothetical protein